jgi:hypothetical protein
VIVSDSVSKISPVIVGSPSLLHLVLSRKYRIKGSGNETQSRCGLESAQEMPPAAFVGSRRL